MNDQEKRDEIAKMLAFIYFEWGKPITRELIQFWRMSLKGMSKAFAWEVAHELVKQKTFGEPKFQDFWQLALKMSRQEIVGGRDYNPWVDDDGRREIVLIDIPGRPKESAPERPLVIEQDGERRREISAPERKLLSQLN